MRWTYGTALMQVLTPKGPLIPTGDKPVLGSVTSSHTIFRFFETFREDVPRNNLLREYKFHIFWTYGSKVMGV
jgi:hypothetical protein